MAVNPDTTTMLKEVIAACHSFLEFPDYESARAMAVQFIELNATVTCSGNVPVQWRVFGASKDPKESGQDGIV